jgi:hypothetical protein
MEPKTEPELTSWRRNQTGTDFSNFVRTETEPEPLFSLFLLLELRSEPNRNRLFSFFLILGPEPRFRVIFGTAVLYWQAIILKF